MTNTAQFPGTDKPTGLTLPELTHVYEVLVKNKIGVDFMSPKGGYVPLDLYSLQSIDDISWRYYGDPSFRDRALGSTLSPEEVDPSEYDIIFFPGGHGTMFDFPDNQEIADIATAIYINGGIVAAICHGVVVLLSVRDGSGELLLKGRTVTGYSNAEEIAGGTAGLVPFFPEDAMKARGANVKVGPPNSDTVRVDGRLLTGQNPFSATSLGEAIVRVLGEVTW